MTERLKLSLQKYKDDQTEMKKVELNEDLRPLYHSKQKSCRFSNVSLN